MSFRFFVILLIFSLEDLSIDVSAVLKSPITVFLLISPFMSVSIFYVFFALVLAAYMLTSVISSLVLIPIIIYNVHVSLYRLF